MFYFLGQRIRIIYKLRSNEITSEKVSMNELN